MANAGVNMWRGLAAFGCFLAMVVYAAVSAPTTAALAASPTEALESMCSDFGSDPQARIKACNDVIATTGETAETKAVAIFYRGEARFEQEKYDEALRDFDQALAITPGLVAAINRRADVYFVRGDFETARIGYDRAIQLQPDSFDGLFGRAYAWQRLGDNERAMADVNSALAADPEDADALLFRGTLWDEKEEYAKALADFDHAIRTRPDFAMAFYDRGRLYLITGDLEKALADLNMALKLQPNYPEAAAARGNVWYGKDDFRRAVADYDLALQLRPDFAPFLDSRGDALIELGEMDRALADIDRSLELDSNDLHTLSDRCWLLGMLNQRLEQAAADCEKAVSRRPVYSGDFDGRALVRFRLGDMKGVVDDASGALKLDAKDAHALLLRGVARQRLGIPGGGEDIAAAKALDPDIFPEYVKRGIAAL